MVGGHTSSSIGPVSGYQFLMCMCTATYAFTSLVGYRRWGARGFTPNDYCFSVLRYALARFLFYSMYVLGWHHALLNGFFYFLLSEGLPNYYFFSTTLQALLDRLRELQRAVDEGDGDGEEIARDPKWHTFLKFMLVPDLEQLLLRASGSAALLRSANACFGWRGFPLGVGLASGAYRVFAALLGFSLFLGFALFHYYPRGEDAEGSNDTAALRRHALLFKVANVGAFAFHVYNAFLAFESDGGGAVDGGGGGTEMNEAGSGKPALMLVLVRVGDALLFWLWTESIPKVVAQQEQGEHED